ncbi:MAG: VWA domain-containing protein [Saprospiraceae bacterium]|nr:VWA domain-containing protein [Saprospiraceae bacterium]
MNNKRKIFNLILLDESGSMHSIKQATIEGFNETAQTIKAIQQQHPEEDHYITLVTFNGMGIKTLLSNQPVMELAEIEAKHYSPNANTPLYDAMGVTFQRLRYQLDLIKNYRVLVSIFTDGVENASKEFTGEAIKRLVEELKSEQWTFTYIGANHDVQKFASQISIHNTITFKSNAESVQHSLLQERNARMRYYQNVRENKQVGENYFTVTPPHKDSQPKD